MKLQYSVILILFALPLLANASDAKSAANKGSAPRDSPSLEEVINDSSLWPFNVNIRRDHFISKGEQLPVSGTFPGILIRMEERNAILDFGREGIHVLPVEQTDFHQRVIGTGGDAFVGEKDLPNFIRYTTNMFLIRESNGTIRNLPLEEMDKETHFLVAYVGQALFEEPSHIAAFKDLQTSLKETGTRTLTFPTDLTFYSRLKDTDLTLTACLMHLVQPMIKTLYHQPGEGPLFVLVDAEGKVLGDWRGQYDQFERLTQEAVQVAHQILAAD